MRTVVWTKYGSPDGVHLAEVEKPVLKPGHVLIRVHATTVTAGESEICRHKMPLPLWLLIGLCSTVLKRGMKSTAAWMP